MNELQIIDQRTVLDKSFTIYGDFENPLFLAKEVAEWIEHSKASIMIETIDSEEKLRETILTSGQNREMWFLTESGLYEVLMQSRKPIAKQFKKQVKEILKEIRKTGSYNVQSEYVLPTNFVEALEFLVIAEKEKQKTLEENQALLLKIEADAPKNFFAEVVTNSKDCILVRDLAKLINQSLNISIGEKRLYAMLREMGYIEKYGRKPLQKSIDLKIMIVTESTRTNSSEGSKLEFTTKITGKGQIYFIDKFKTMQENGKLEILQEKIKEKEQVKEKVEA